MRIYFYKEQSSRWDTGGFFVIIIILLVLCERRKRRRRRRSGLQGGREDSMQATAADRSWQQLPFYITPTRLD